MNIHKNACLTRHGRERIVRQVESGQTAQASARGWFANGLTAIGAKDWPACRIALPGLVSTPWQPKLTATNQSSRPVR